MDLKGHLPPRQNSNQDRKFPNPSHNGPPFIKVSEIEMCLDKWQLPIEGLKIFTSMRYH